MKSKTKILKSFKKENKSKKRFSLGCNNFLLKIFHHNITNSNIIKTTLLCKEAYRITNRNNNNPCHNIHRGREFNLNLRGLSLKIRF